MEIKIALEESASVNSVLITYIKIPLMKMHVHAHIL